MKKVISMILVVLMIFSLAACAQTEPTKPTLTEKPTETVEPTKPTEDPKPEDPSVIQPSETDAKCPDNLDTLAKIMDSLGDEENIMYSPFSFNMALVLLSEGASETVKKDFENYFGVSFDTYIQFYQQYMANLDKTVEIANAMWLNDGFEYSDEFVKAVSKELQTDLRQGTFNEERLNEINQWCAEKTHDMIPFILKELDPSWVSVTLNALYFKGEWEEKYEKSRKTDFIGKTATQVDGLFSKENI